jgi:hypothetical protein
MVIRRQPIRRPSLLIFIEFPAVATVGVPFDAVAGEMQRLLGRLRAVDRLIDIVSDAAGPDILSRTAVAALKRNALLRILDVEEPHLPTCKKMIAELRAALKGN